MILMECHQWLYLHFANHLSSSNSLKKRKEFFAMIELVINLIHKPDEQCGAPIAHTLASLEN